MGISAAHIVLRLLPPPDPPSRGLARRNLALDSGVQELFDVSQLGKGQSRRRRRRSKGGRGTVDILSYPLLLARPSVVLALLGARAVGSNVKKLARKGSCLYNQDTD